MKSLEFTCPATMHWRDVLAISNAAEKTGKQVYIQRNKNGRFANMSSIMSMLSMRFRKKDKLFMLCYDDDSEAALMELKNEFQSRA